ncbi:MAG TPA: dTMP kinase [Bdellovibrionales bacterium]|nr:dTMP kinase [Bdellovibrionales bacterium]
MRFIAFEGLDGSGKSTLIHGLKAEFETRGQGYVISREPGGSELGVEIRQMLLRNLGPAPVPRAEALLYQADRAQHVDTVIRPALEQKKWVLSDRFAASSVAFQAGGRALSVPQIDWLNEFSTAGLKPDLYVLLDLTVEESMKRLAGRPGEADRFELESRDFHEKVRQAYLRMASAEPARWLVLPAADKPGDLRARLLGALKDRRWLV